MSLDLPAWSEPFAEANRDKLRRGGPWGRVDRTWAFGDGSGRGVRVAIVDSGVERDHPAVGGRLVESVAVERVGDDWQVVPTRPNDVVGHGTACAGIIHALAPEAELVSVRVLGKNNRGKGLAFAYGLDWVIQQGIHVANLSLSSRSEDLYASFHDLVDQAYFANTTLICAASNTPGQASYPSLYSSVISVARRSIHHTRPRP